MARKKKQASAAPPSDQGPDTDELAAQDAATAGRPEHGSVHPDFEHDDTDPDPNSIEDSDDEAQDPPADPTPAQLQAQMLKMEERHAEELAALRRQQPPTEQKAPKPGEADNKDDEYEQLLFNNPKEAVKRIKAEAVAEATHNLRAEYQKDRNTQKFWESFDKKYPDLAEDRDLVEMTMNANLAKLVNIPVEKAMKEIAELTRGRISRYTQGRRPQKRAFAEGAQPPAPHRAREEPEKIPSLTDIVRARRARRLNKASAA